MNKKHFFINNYRHLFQEQQHAAIIQTLSQTYPTYFIESLCIIGIMTTVGIRIIHMENPAEYLVQLAAFAVGAFRILPNISRISSTFSYFMFQIPSANEVYYNMKEAEEYLSNSQSISKCTDISSNVCNAYSFSNKLSINNISFKYPDGQDYVLKNISLSIDKGDAVAFVGPSGAGKSTLVDIILGLYHLDDGSISLDGIDIHSNPSIWANCIGYVPQAPFLFDDTVRRNIAFGHDDDEIDDSIVWNCLDQAQMKSYIAELPTGLDTMVGDRGIRFSGGQAQRLAIARALYSDPQILILDEATSSLDSDTENAIMESINALHRKKTMIIIAHRLTTIKDCDHIYEVRDGSITEKQYSELH